MKMNIAGDAELEAELLDEQAARELAEAERDHLAHELAATRRQLDEERAALEVLASSWISAAQAIAKEVDAGSAYQRCGRTLRMHLSSRGRRGSRIAPTTAGVTA
jgi:hypothetical protein